jgi:hypothetical protein
MVRALRGPTVIDSRTAVDSDERIKIAASMMKFTGTVRSPDVGKYGDAKGYARPLRLSSHCEP